MKNNDFLEKKEKKRKKFIKEHINKEKKENQLYFDKKDFDELNINKKNSNISKYELQIINQENYIVSKPNDLIQNTIFDFSATELKCLNYCICKLIPNKEYKKFTKNGKDWHLEFKLQEVFDALKLRGTTGEYTNIKESLFNLKKSQKEVKFIENGKEIQKPFNYFLDVEVERDLKEDFDEKEREYTVRILFDGNLVNSLQNTKNRFTAITQVYSSRLKYKYSIRMYELCKSWQNHEIFSKGENFYGFTFYIERAIKEWYLPKSYDYKDIKRNVIDKAIEEINSKTDIFIEIKEPVKKDKKTIGLLLSIKPNPNFTEIYKDIEKERKEFIEQKESRKSRNTEEKEVLKKVREEYENDIKTLDKNVPTYKREEGDYIIYIKDGEEKQIKKGSKEFYKEGAKIVGLPNELWDEILERQEKNKK